MRRMDGTRCCKGRRAHSPGDRVTGEGRCKDMPFLPPDSTQTGLGITNRGSWVENEFRRITGSSRLKNAEGDAELSGCRVEIKTASTQTVNQVRPLKYLTLVIFDTKHKEWYVVPANVIVEYASAKMRGQHTEIAFECMTLRIDKLPAKFKTTEAQLGEAVKNAEAEAGASPIKDHIAPMVEAIRGLAQTLRENITQFTKEPHE
jgi:hypothetical protein